MYTTVKPTDECVGSNVQVPAGTIEVSMVLLTVVPPASVRILLRT
jgi:hypothetical protein